MAPLVTAAHAQAPPLLPLTLHALQVLARDWHHLPPGLQPRIAAAIAAMACTPPRTPLPLPSRLDGLSLQCSPQPSPAGVAAAHEGVAGTCFPGGSRGVAAGTAEGGEVGGVKGAGGAAEGGGAGGSLGQGGGGQVVVAVVVEVGWWEVLWLLEPEVKWWRRMWSSSRVSRALAPHMQVGHTSQLTLTK